MNTAHILPVAVKSSAKPIAANIAGSGWSRRFPIRFKAVSVDIRSAIPKPDSNQAAINTSLQRTARPDTRPQLPVVPAPSH